MANLVDIWAETQAGLIGDDAQPTLSLTNSSTGPGLFADRVVVTGAASIGGALNFAGVLSGNTTITSNATQGRLLTFNRTVIGSPTVGLAVFSVSGASVPVFEFKANALVSAVSIVFAASGNWAGTYALRIKAPDDTLKWIPVLPDGCVTAAAI